MTTANGPYSYGPYLTWRCRLVTFYRGCRSVSPSWCGALASSGGPCSMEIVQSYSASNFVHLPATLEADNEILLFQYHGYILTRNSYRIKGFRYPQTVNCAVGHRTEAVCDLSIYRHRSRQNSWLVSTLSASKSVYVQSSIRSTLGLIDIGLLYSLCITHPRVIRTVTHS